MSFPCRFTSCSPRIRVLGAETSAASRHLVHGHGGVALLQPRPLRRSRPRGGRERSAARRCVGFAGVSSTCGPRSAEGQGVRREGPVSRGAARLPRPHRRCRRGSASHKRAYLAALACRIRFRHLHRLRDLAVLDRCADRLHGRAAGDARGRRHRYCGHPPTQTTRRAWLRCEAELGRRTSLRAMPGRPSGRLSLAAYPSVRPGRSETQVDLSDRIWTQTADLLATPNAWGWVGHSDTRR